MSTATAVSPSQTYSPHEAADRLGVSRRTLMAWAQDGRIARVVLGGPRGRRIVRFREADLAAFLDRNTIPADRGRR